jgi:hypothetical protein
MGSDGRGLFTMPGLVPGALDEVLVVVVDEGVVLDKAAEADTGEMVERLVETDEGVVFDRLVSAV